MKKSFLTVALILGSATTFAQEKQYLPEAGDWAIGIDAAPLLNYFGNFIGGNGLNTAPAWGFPTWNQTISGKYFVTKDMAYRASIRLGFGSQKGSQMVDQDGVAAPTYPNLPATVEDSYKAGGSSIGLAGGLEMRKGSGRLIGFYGAELGLNFASNNASYTYGNAARVTESNSGMSTTIGVRGFIGAEYFILPKMSIGGEFGWGLGLQSDGASSMSMESTDGVAVGKQTIEGTKSSTFVFDTDNNNSVVGVSGALKLTLHF